MAFVSGHAVGGRSRAVGPAVSVAPKTAIARAARSGSRRAHLNMMVTEIESKAGFDAALSSAGDALVVIDYSTTWCGPCKLVAPKFEEMSDAYKNVVFLKVTGDKNAETNQLMQSNGIRSVPTFHYYKAGEKVYEVTGAKVADIEAGIKSHM
ncbi:Thioredoxin [Porphyridium purpureum]|uniref:Thioredoxin n=1 Tax=Porphyridium purpureum TaxID=35688 RepID=A0A5J4YLQ2_PORPP|nr:Thioredoxin [Porphyridium purpureum]|eukprot:POR6573..scf244_11